MSVTSGWGRLTWDQSQWGGSTILNTGWGAQSWGDSELYQLSYKKTRGCILMDSQNGLECC